MQIENTAPIITYSLTLWLPFSWDTICTQYIIYFSILGETYNGVFFWDTMYALDQMVKVLHLACYERLPFARFATKTQYRVLSPDTCDRHKLALFPVDTFVMLIR